MAKKTDPSIRASRLVDRIAKGDTAARAEFEDTLLELMGPQEYAADRERCARLGIPTGRRAR